MLSRFIIVAAFGSALTMGVVIGANAQSNSGPPGSSGNASILTGTNEANPGPKASKPTKKSKSGKTRKSRNKSK